MNPVILYTLASLGGIGFVMGGMLAFAAKKFHVEVDPRVEKVIGILPGANCGGCGYAGCAAYAEAVVINGEKETLCAPGGPSVCQELAKLLGREQTKNVRKVAYLHCAGSNDKAKDKYIWDGIKDCRVAAMVAGGMKSCSYGCLGLGTCEQVCPFDAIHMNENGLPVVDREKCTACGACVRACPKNLYELLPDTSTIYLACSSRDKGKKVKDACSVGCIACGICAKVTEGWTGRNAEQSAGGRLSPVTEPDSRPLQVPDTFIYRSCEKTSLYARRQQEMHRKA